MRTVKEIEEEMKTCTGEPCGGLLMHCRNPHHSRYFHLSEELRRAKWCEARAKKRNAGAVAEMVARSENVEGDGI